MDWKQFFASVIGAVAWPTAFLVLLFMLRKQIPSLAERLEELSLPGGAKAKFEKQLETARIEAEKLPDAPSEPEHERIVPEGDERRFVRLAASAPEQAIVETYNRVEGILIKIALELGIESGTSSSAILDDLLRRGLIDTSLVQLAKTLSEARNVAAHVRPGRLTTAEALDFREHTEKLLGRLSYLLGRVDVMENDPR
jgi:hypothetical protein